MLLKGVGGDGGLLSTPTTICFNATNPTSTDLALSLHFRSRTPEYNSLNHGTVIGIMISI
jgi:hypothetical protein